MNPDSELLFTKYQQNSKDLAGYFRQLDENLAEGEYPQNSITISRERYLRNTGGKRIPMDYSFHTCNLTSYPQNLSPDWRYTHWGHFIALTETQEIALKEAYKGIKWELVEFYEAAKVARGMWIDYLFEKFQIRANPDTYSNGSHGLVLKVLNEKFLEIIQSLATRKDLRSINRVYHDPRGAHRGALSITIDIRDYVKRKDFPEGVYESMSGKSDDRAVPEPVIEKLDLNERRNYITSYMFELFAKEYFICEHFDQVVCELCLETFLPQSETAWINILTPRFCENCINLSFSDWDYFFQKLGFKKGERKNNAIVGVKTFYEVFGFIPPTNFSRKKTIKEFQQDNFDLDSLILALKVSTILPKRELALSLFGTWQHLLNAANLLEISDRGRGGYKSIASDNHLCLSLGERAVCEFLTKHGIDHEKEPKYPSDSTLNPNGSLRGDFKVREVIIEFAGMMQIPSYASRMKKKELLAKQFGVPWIKLQSSDRLELDNLLAFLIEH